MIPKGFTTVYLPSTEPYLLWDLLYSWALWRFTPSGSGWDSKNAVSSLWAHTRGKSRLENGSWNVSLSARHTHEFWASCLCRRENSSELIKMEKIWYKNSAKSELQSNINTPCHWLFYMEGNVVIATVEVFNLSREEFLYWTPVSRP